MFSYLFCTTLFPEIKTRHVLLYHAVESQSEQLQKHTRNADRTNFTFSFFRSNKAVVEREESNGDTGLTGEVLATLTSLFR